MNIGMPRQTYLKQWEGQLPIAGDYLRTGHGAFYAIISAKPPRAGSASVLVMWIWRTDEASVDMSRCHEISWL